MPTQPTTAQATFPNASAQGPRTPRIRAGIIGAGFIGEVHARAVRAAGSTLTAIADATPDLAAQSAQRLGATWGAPSAAALIGSGDVDVVHICTPNHLHAPLAKSVLDAGKHVICEKPLATTEEDARDLAERAATAGVVAAIPFVYRFYPTVRDARARVASGETGPVRLLHGSYLQDWLSSTSDTNWRVDPAAGGASRAFGDIGVHWCDVIEFTTGHRITALTAKLSTAITERASGSVDTEDAAAVVFTTDQGALGSLVISQVSPGRKNRLWFSIDGADRSLAFDQEAPETLWVGSREATTLVGRGTPAMTDQAARYSILPAGHPQGYQDSFNAFVADAYAAIAGDPPDGLPTFADGHRASRITAAVLASARSGSWVEVAP
jgi:predicted dehydrogenase